MRKVKIEYEPHYGPLNLKWSVYIKDGFWSRWELKNRCESLEHAQKEASELLKYPIYLNDVRSGEL